MEENPGNRVSDETISTITNPVFLGIKAWKSRVPYPLYPVVWMDAIHYKSIDDSRCAASRSVYNVTGVNTEGYKELPGMHVSRGEVLISGWRFSPVRASAAWKTS
jgi:transposase-like protein